MARTNKYIYLFVVQGYYHVCGWEDLCASESYREARRDLESYNDEESYRHRIVRRREPNPAYTG